MIEGLRGASVTAACGSYGPAYDVSVAETALSIGWDVLVGRTGEAHFRHVPGLGVRVLTP